MAISKLTMASELNPLVWDEKTLKPEIKKRLLAISKKFLEDVIAPIKIKYIILTGSLCTYTWRPESDFDLHIIAEPSQEDCKETVLDYFKVKSSEFNDKHDITIKGYQVEVNLKDIESEYEDKAIYDLIKDSWIVEPKPYTGDLLGKPEVLKLAHEYQNRIDDLIVSRAPLSEFKKIRDELRELRKKSLAEGGEYSVGNLVFKTLRYSGHLEKIANYRLSLFDKEMSLETFAKFFETDFSV
jgi:uncharacterized protein YeeX (DUF496 family)